ncbi:Ig-like domain-containing protein, partial [Flavobacterium mesophilum]|uniref:Ig-like domain-containing protein n=1 Tax=Flavobacterium mesophilum TaxID=3143495 RepID=UPI0031E4B98E
MHNSTFNRSRFSRLNFFIAFLLLISFSASAQFYTKHYIAPAPWQYFSKSNEIVIATNSETPVSIKLYRSNGVLETTLSAVKGAPAIYRFQLLAKDLPMHALNTVISGAGLIVESAGPTSVNMRNVASDDNSGDNNDAYLKGNAALTSFGDAGLGVRFRVGYYRDGTLGSFSTFGDQRPIYSIMATVNNTSVKINNAIVTTLNAGQSYLFKAAIGTLVESSSPAVMNTAAAIDMPDGCGDSAYNQIPPESVLGTEYFIERGKGNNKAEQTTVVATKDDTHLVINTYSTSGAVVGTTNVTLATAGSFHTFNNGSLDTPFSASRVAADKRVVVYSGTAQSCEVDISTIAPVSECGGSNFIETAKFRNYGTGTLPYFGYILLRSQNDPVMVNGTNIETRSGIAARHQLGNTGWYVINFEDTQIGSPDVLSISCDTKMTVSIVQQGGGFSMAGFFSNFAAQPDEPTLTYISGGGCTNNTAELTTPPNFDPYQWYFNGTAISGANSSTYTATKTGNYTVASTLACGVQTQSKPVNVILCTDLGITKTVDNPTPCIGTNVEFTVKVSNLGGNNVSGVSVNDLLPSGYTYVSSTPSVGVYDSSTGTWSIGDVDAQTSVTLKITATVKSSGNYTNTATLPASIDTNTANNSASAAVNPNPVVTLVTNAFTACVSGDLTAASVTAGSSNNLTFSYWTNSAATSAVANPTSVSGGTYYIKAVSAEGCSAVKSVVVTVNTAPGTPTITSRTSGATINNGSISCFGGSSVTLRATSSSGYLWSTGETTRDIVVTTDGTYSVKVLNSSNCISVSSSPVMVTLAPAPVASNQTFCSSENKKIGDLVATGSYIKWYSASSGGTALSSTQSLPTTAGNYNYYATQTLANNCESPRTSAIVITINNTSSAPTASAQTFCSADNKKISDLSPSGPTIKWYDTNTSTSALAGTTTLTSKTYYVSQTANSCGESARTAVLVTINNIPSAPTASSQTFCGTDSKTVNDLIATGTNLKWYNQLTGGTLYNGTETLASGSYYVSQSNSCGESTRTSVNVTVNNTAAPTASAQSFCLPDAKKVSNLVATGTSLKWYNASTGGTQYTGNETLSSNNYYVSQTLNGCESPRTLVVVTVTNATAPTASSLTFCSADGKKVSDLTVTSGTNLKWYTASTGGTQYTGNEILSSNNYYVSQTINNCESTRTLVSVTVNPTPATPTINAGGSTTFCTGGNVVLTSTSGIGYLWSNGATTQSITVSNSGNYSVQVTNASGCYSASSTPVTVTVNNIPTAPSASSQTFCIVDGKKVSDLVATGSNLKWYDASSNGTLYIGTETLVDGIYYVSQTTNGCESSRTAVNVTVTPKPAKVITTAAICSGDTYNWSVNSTNYTATGTYTVSNNGCTADQELQLTVTPKPAKIITTATICSGDTYNWPVNSANYTATGTYTVSNNGCTADQELQLTVTPKPAKVITTATICSGDTYNWSVNSVNYTATGTYTVSNNGCTADQELQLTVTPKPAKVITTATICSGDTYNWSVNSANYTATGTYTVSNNGCTADQELQLTVTPKPAKVITTATICSGDTYNWSVNSVNYTATGTYTVSNNGCTADQELQLTVTPKPAKVITTATICSGDTYNWPANSTNYTATGTYTVSNNGCTADQELQLTVTPKPAKVITTAAICSGDTYNWPANSTNYTATGTYMVANNGCTADQELQLTVTPKPAKVITTAAICSGDTYNWSVNSANYTATGTYTVSNNGCTADQELQLTVTPKPAKIITTAAICSGDTYNWSVNSANYTATGTYTVSNNGCTADQELQLTVTPKPAKVITTATICSGDTYNWPANSTNYTATGTYTVSNNGCTADQELQLTVTPKPAKIITTATICSGDTYNWPANSTNYTATGTYTVSNNGCTADQELQLTVTPKPAKIITTATICSGDTYNWPVNSANYTATGTYTVSNNGCTADQELQLTVTPKPAKVITTATICSGDTYNWSVNSANYTATGTYTVANNGCTADQELQLTVTPKPAKIITTATICSGDTYNWSVNSTNYTATGTYTVSNNGCTADQELQLTVTPKPAKIITTATICSGDTYNWSVNSVNYTATGTYTVSNNGCTADQELQLTVTPKPTKIITTATICSGDTYNWSVNSANYTATGTYTVSNNGCTADQELQLTVTPKPAKIITTATICSGDTYNWSVNSTNYTATGTYTVSNNGCTADQELQLTVTPKPAKVITTATICSGDTYNWQVNS